MFLGINEAINQQIDGQMINCLNWVEVKKERKEPSCFLLPQLFIRNSLRL